jgi:hypothetical protein
VIDALEDAEDYAAFEMAITADFDAQFSVERELVLRLASLLWRLRRATAIEIGLFKIQAQHLFQFRQRRQAHQCQRQTIERPHPNVAATLNDGAEFQQHEDFDAGGSTSITSEGEPDDLTRSFLRLSNLPTYPLDRLSRYEATLWRQAYQILFALQLMERRKPWERMRARIR